MCIPKHKRSFYKCWWTQELDVLKEMAISSCRAWKDAGKPKHGNIYQQYEKDKLLYKKNVCVRNRQMKLAFLQMIYMMPCKKTWARHLESLELKI
jgi:hypothetical protein